MHKFIATIKKECIQLLRDPGGLTILFLMPIVLVITITLIQDSTFKAITGNSIDILLVDKDKGRLSSEIIDNFRTIDFLNPIIEKDGKPLTEEQVSTLVASGDYQLGVVIPEGLTKDLDIQIQNNINTILAEFVQSEGEDQPKEKRNKLSQKTIKLYFDPITQETFRSSVIFSVDKMIAAIETKSIYTAFEKEIGETKGLQSFNRDQFVSFDQINPSLSGATNIPNSVQHNIPAWTLFAIFFMIIPLSLNVVHEKRQGTFMRLQTTPVSYFTIIGSKAFVFLMVSLLQFTIILFIGVFIFPKFGLPILEIGNYLGLLYLVAFASGMAATGLGILIGTLFSTHEQAAPFSAILIIILAAIGGVWVPVFAMPEMMQNLAKISPLNWGLEGFYDCFLRKGSFTNILPELGLLITFFMSTIIIAIKYYEKKKTI